MKFKINIFSSHGQKVYIVQEMNFFFLQEVKILKEDLATRLNSNETAELLNEKEDQIKGLMEEGRCE